MAKHLGGRYCPASVGESTNATARPPLLLQPRLQQRRGARPAEATRLLHEEALLSLRMAETGITTETEHANYWR
eukprot:4404044-Alexandrium_andersonii.AAC.1